MNDKTSLEEVAQHLPADTARILLHESMEVQMLVLSGVRTVIASLESRGHVLDPILYGDVLMAATISLIPMAQTIESVAKESRTTATKLRAAEILLEVLASQDGEKVEKES